MVPKTVESPLTRPEEESGGLFSNPWIHVDVHHILLKQREIRGASWRDWMISWDPFTRVSGR
jgi:hypothetical protein